MDRRSTRQGAVDKGRRISKEGGESAGKTPIDVRLDIAMGVWHGARLRDTVSNTHHSGDTTVSTDVGGDTFYRQSCNVQRASAFPMRPVSTSPTQLPTFRLRPSKYGDRAQGQEGCRCFAAQRYGTAGSHLDPPKCCSTRDKCGERKPQKQMSKLTKSHNGASSGLFGDLGLLDVHDVHDDTGVSCVV